MKKVAKVILVSFVLLMFVLDFSAARVFAQGINFEKEEKRNEQTLMIDQDYLFALRSLDRFLDAWVMRDFKEGPQYVTEALKKSEQDHLQMFFCGVSNPHHQAYEVTGLKYINKDTIRFKVWLYEHVTGQAFEPVKKPEPYYIDVVKVDSEQWLVNTLPMFLKTNQ